MGSGINDQRQTDSPARGTADGELGGAIAPEPLGDGGEEPEADESKAVAPLGEDGQPELPTPATPGAGFRPQPAPLERPDSLLAPGIDPVPEHGLIHPPRNW